MIWCSGIFLLRVLLQHRSMEDASIEGYCTTLRRWLSSLRNKVEGNCCLSISKLFSPVIYEQLWAVPKKYMQEALGRVL